MDHTYEPEIPATWDRAGLSAVGFVGFVLFAGQKTAEVPSTDGVYVLLRESAEPAELLEVNPARVGAGRQASYDVGDLRKRLTPDSPVVYIGKAAASRGGLRKRLSQFRRMSASHSGGRSVWQLADSAGLVVGCRETPGMDPAIYESALIAGFASRFGRRPFANRKD